MNVRIPFTQNTVFVNRLRRERSQSFHVLAATPLQCQVFCESFATAVKIVKLRQKFCRSTAIVKSSVELLRQVRSDSAVAKQTRCFKLRLSVGT